jgi:glycerol-3-phosphate cytidylyltransferase
MSRGPRRCFDEVQIDGSEILKLESMKRSAPTPVDRYFTITNTRQSGDDYTMIRIGYVPGAFDLFHIGDLNILRQAKENCDYLIAGVSADDVLIRHKGVTPVIPLLERLEIVRNVRYVNMAHAAMTNDKIEIWKELRFNVLFKGDDWRGSEKGNKLERDFAGVGVDVVYFPYTQATSSSALRQTLQNIDAIATRARNIATLETATAA